MEIHNFDFENAKNKVMKKIEDGHFIWQRIENNGELSPIQINYIKYQPNLLLLQCELKELFPSYTRSRKFCDKEHCINPDHWIILNDDDAYYKLAERNLLKNSYKEGNCRLWTGSLDDDGYGKSQIGGNTYGAHKVAMIVSMKSEIDKNLKVRHKCRNKNCIEIAHLELGTAQDNVNDQIRDGTKLEGGKHHCAKLTDNDVKNIVDQKDKISKTELSNQHNISVQTIDDIYKGKTWNSVTGLPKLIKHNSEDKTTVPKNMEVEFKKGCNYIINRVIPLMKMIKKLFIGFGNLN